jgi:hypothetical protein
MSRGNPHSSIFVGVIGRNKITLRLGREGKLSVQNMQRATSLLNQA